MIDRCYLEITNVCNLDCVFCPKNGRKKHLLTVGEFDALTDRLKGEIKFLYFHLMGEPMLHPELPAFVRMARDKGFIPVLTTNGTLLEGEKGQKLIEAKPHKVQISLHSHEGNGFDSSNNQLLDLLASHITQPWTKRYDGWKLAGYIYLEFDQMFEWPDEQNTDYGQDDAFCYALRKQVGVLVDGTVVPCCLDHEGSIALGNLFNQSLAEVLASPRTQAMYEGFSRHQAVEELCRHCGYAMESKRFRKK